MFSTHKVAVLMGILLVSSTGAQIYNYAKCGPNMECVPTKLCIDGNYDTSGSTGFDDRMSNDVCNALETCCLLPESRRTTTIVPPTTVVPPTTSGSPPTSTQPPTTTASNNFKGCGYSTPQSSDFDIKSSYVGVDAEFAEFPWMVAVLKKQFVNGAFNPKYHCGGSLIAPNAILTAAHKVIGQHIPFLSVRAGYTGIEEKPWLEDINVNRIILHGDYDRKTLYNDFAILILEKSYQWKDNIQPICLPPPNTNFDGSQCLTIGWGKKTLETPVIIPDALKKIDVPFVERNACWEFLRRTRLSPKYILHESFVCAGGEEGRDACTGDGGSPLMCPITGQANRYFATGLVAYGVGCGKKDQPGVYANVAFANEWIRQTLTSNGISLIYSTA